MKDSIVMRGPAGITRRRTLASLAGMAALGTAPAIVAPAIIRPARAAGSASLAFRLFRDGDDIGAVRLDFAGGGGDLSVALDIDIAVKVLGITAYVYKQAARETWRDGRLVDLQSSGDDDGDSFLVSAKAVGGELQVDGPEGRTTMPGWSIPSSYWHAGTLRSGILLNTRKGRPITYRVNALGQKPLSTSAGSITAGHYALRGGLDLDIWYTQAQQWVSLSFDGKGEPVTYRLNASDLGRVAALTRPVVEKWRKG